LPAIISSKKAMPPRHGFFVDFVDEWNEDGLMVIEPFGTKERNTDKGVKYPSGSG
jgi:hypothetical protein